jgi:hypothetical protein
LDYYIDSETGEQIPADQVDGINYKPVEQSSPSWLDLIGASAAQAVPSFAKIVSGPGQFLSEAASTISGSTLGDAALRTFGVNPDTVPASKQFFTETNQLANDVAARQIPEAFNIEPGSNADFYTKLAGGALPTAAQAIFAPQTILPTMAAQGFGESYPRLRENGASIGSAALGATGDAALNYLGGKVVVPGLTNPAYGPLRRVGQSALFNAIQNPAQEAASMGIQEYATGNDIPSEEYGRRLAEAAVGGAVTGAAFGAAGELGTRIQQAETKKSLLAEQLRAEAELQKLAQQQAEIDGNPWIAGAEDQPQTAGVEAPQPRVPNIDPMAEFQASQAAGAQRDFNSKFVGPQELAPEQAFIDRLQAPPPQPAPPPAIIEKSPILKEQDLIDSTFPDVVKAVKDATRNDPAAQSRFVDQILPKPQPPPLGLPAPQPFEPPRIQPVDTYSGRSPEQSAAMEAYRVENQAKSLPELQAAGQKAKNLTQEADALQARIDAQPWTRGTVAKWPAAKAAVVENDVASVVEAVSKKRVPRKRNKERGAVENPASLLIEGFDNIRTTVENFVDAGGSERAKLKYGIWSAPEVSKGEQRLRRGFGLGWAATKSIFPKTFADKTPLFRPQYEAGRVRDKEIFFVAQDLGNKVQSFFSLPKESRDKIGRMARMINETTVLAQKKGRPTFAPSDDFLAKNLGLSPAEVKGYQEVRGMLDFSVDYAAQGLMARRGGAPLPAVVQAKLAAWKEDNYVPNSRFGEYYVAARVKDGDAIHFSQHETKAEALRVAKELRKNEYEVEMDKLSPTSKEMHSGLDVGTLGRLGSIDPDVLAKGSGIPVKGMEKHFKTKNFVRGANEDFGRTVADYITSLSNWTANQKFESVANSTIGSFGRGGRGSEALARDYAIRHKDYVLGNVNENQKIRQGLSLYFLGGNVRSAVVNLTQSLTTTQAVLANQLGEVKAAKLYVKSWKHANDYRTGALAKADPELHGAITKALADGLIAEDAYKNIAGMADPVGGVKSAGRKFADLWMAGFGQAEKLNRYHALISGYELARAKGIAPEARLKFAERFVDDTQFVNSKSNRPEMARGPVLAPLFTFKLFAGNWLRLVRDQKGVKAKIRMLAPMFALGGTTALPLAKELVNVLQGMGIDVNKEIREQIKEMGGNNKIADGVLYGIPAGLPDDYSVNISGSVGFGEVASNIGDKKGFEAVASVLGAPGAVVNRAAQFYKQGTKTGEWGRASEALLPEGVRFLARANRVRKEGLRDTRNVPLISGDTPLTPDQISNYQMAAYALGFTPTEFSRAYEQRQAEFNAKDRASNSENVNWKLAKALFDGDDAKFDALIADAASKGIKPNSAQIKKSYIEMQDPTLFARVPKKALDDVIEARQAYED